MKCGATIPSSAEREMNMNEQSGDRKGLWDFLVTLVEDDYIVPTEIVDLTMGGTGYFDTDNPGVPGHGFSHGVDRHGRKVIYVNAMVRRSDGNEPAVAKVAVFQRYSDRPMPIVVGELIGNQAKWGPFSSALPSTVLEFLITLRQLGKAKLVDENAWEGEDGVYEWVVV